MKDLGRYATVVLLLKKEDAIIKFWLAPKKQNIHTKSESLEDSMLMNGPGGKLEPEDNGSMCACASREVWDEFRVKVSPEKLIFAAKIRFYKSVAVNLDDFFMEVTFFLALEYEGTPIETEEMGEPKLFSIDTAPFDTNMMPADKGIFSCIMSGKEMEGSVFFKKDKQGRRLVDMWNVAINTPKVPFF